MLRAAALYRTQWLVVDLSPKVFLTCLLGCLRQASGLVRSMTYAALPWLWELSRDLSL